MKTFLIFDTKKEKSLPLKFRRDDIRNPENIVRYFIQKFTKKGDRVFDPFAGFGTTLIVSEKLRKN